MISFQFNETEGLFNDARLQSEWLETNGLGGWASSAITGCHSRRYHGLLVAATKPPIERTVMVSKLDETIVVNNERFELGVNNYGDVVHPQGFQYLKSFVKTMFPQFVYEAGGVQLRKSILMVHGENTTIIKYEVLKAPARFSIELLPLLAGRGYHQLMHANNTVPQQSEMSDGQYSIRLYDGTPAISIQFPGCVFHQNPAWYYHLSYSIEQYRGLDHTEDLFSPGYFSSAAKEGYVFYVLLSTETKGLRNAPLLFEAEIERREALLKKEKNVAVRHLTLAADQFIVRRSENLKTVIAGYHWFTDWSRDTMISLSGLTLSTGRFEDARKILSAFAQVVDLGMLPNRFQDTDEAPEYNTVDGTLWYFVGVYNYLKATKDKAFVLAEILPKLKEIIDWHYRGTRYNIRLAEDGLLHAGEDGVQLTWMDAKVGGWVVTPRTGKAVEVQALWYNALCIFSELLLLNGQEEDALKMSEQAQRAKASFEEKFWYGAGGYLYDVIDENNNPDSSLRPNQLLAISLPFQLLNGDRSKSVMRVVEEKLLTPKGLRSLSPNDNRYVPQYGGDAWHRDGSYHQGTVWSWLLGPYIDALYRTNGSSAALSKAVAVIRNFLPHLQEAGIGTVSEIFDANAPFAPRGCMAQAWGVAEILRVIKAYRLGEMMNTKAEEKATAGE
jgi:predicted glycogen debranching enzyme